MTLSRTIKFFFEMASEYGSLILWDEIKVYGINLIDLSNGKMYIYGCVRADNLGELVEKCCQHGMLEGTIQLGEVI